MENMNLEDEKYELIEVDEAALAESSAFQQYMHDITQYPLLTQEEEMKYAIMYRDGNDSEKRIARDVLINHNLRYVVKMAGKYRQAQINIMDLIQEGNIGLMRAVEKYDIDMGFRFTTYATWWIKQSIGRAIADKGRAIRVPVHLHELNHKMQKIEKEAAAQGIRYTDEQLAVMLDISEEKVRTLKVDVASISSLNGTLRNGDDDKDSELQDYLASEDMRPDQIAEQHCITEELDKMMDITLTVKEKDVLKKRFGIDEPEPMTLEEIGKIYNVTRERIRQLEAKGLRKLQNPKYARQLRDLLYA